MVKKKSLNEKSRLNKTSSEAGADTENAIWGFGKDGDSIKFDAHEEDQVKKLDFNFDVIIKIINNAKKTKEGNETLPTVPQ